MIEIIASVLLFLGSFFMLVASIGMLRLPDLYTRMHAATKAGTLGVTFILAATCVLFYSCTVLAESIILIGFIFTSAPIAAHLLARSAYKTDEYFYNPSQVNELQGHSHENDLSNQ